MSRLPVGKLFVRFIKDWVSIIREPTTTLRTSSNYYHWYGVMSPELYEKKSIKDKMKYYTEPYKIKDWNDELRKEQESIRLRNSEAIKKQGRATRPCEITEGKGTWTKEKKPNRRPKLPSLPKVYPHELAEAEEKEAIPDWGTITSEDTNFQNK